MSGLTMIKGILDRGGRAPGLALAVLTFLWVISVLASAQGRTFEPTFGGGVFVAAGDIVGLARGQTLRVTVPDSIQANQDGRAATRGTARSDVQRSRVSLVVVTFNGQTTTVAQTDEIEIPAGGSHSFDFKRDDINLPGEPVTGRLELRIEVRSLWRSGGRAQIKESGAGLFLPIFEVVDNADGKTTVHGTLVKTGTGTLTLSGNNTY
jgi:hypothetical protein